MRPRFDYGDEVRVTRNVRNDGTYPGLETGQLLVRRGSTGHVRDVGTFLQDQIIYTVHFIDQDRVIGCREEELLAADDHWVESEFEYRDRVIARVSLAIGGEVIAAAGAGGEIEKVLRDAPGGVAYEVRFPGRTLQVPETALAIDPENLNELQKQKLAEQEAVDG
ncbi:MAG: nitrogen fixation protein NifZ [Zetaproteobacteria bacterium CG_4_9_14_3_um_filter_54_145]|nr:MAG: nitrogen fixation protein NifZ [Zetaproteobacteria bacterium CG_4_9_14_3_um_filter_54_145]